jgi:hypothetical protein
MHDGVDQVKAWKDSEGTEGAAEHPAGEVQLPKGRVQVARAMALAGIVVGLSAVVEAGTLQTNTTTAP